MEWIVIDTETTGLIEDASARLVEVAVARFDEAGRLVAAYSSLVCPEILTDDGIVVLREISGFSEDEIRAAPSSAQVWEELSVITRGWTYPVYAWNLEFDRAMIERTWPDAVLPWARCLMRDFATRWVTVFGHHEEDGNPRHVRLTRAASIAGLEPEGPLHRALTDAILAGRVWSKVARGEIVPPVIVPRGAPLIVRWSATEPPEPAPRVCKPKIVFRSNPAIKQVNP